MSDVAQLRQVKPARPHLPVSWYFDPAIFELEKKLLFDWIDNGMPEGNPAELPEPATFTDGWQIPKPDLVIEMPKAFMVPARTCGTEFAAGSIIRSIGSGMRCDG